MMPFDILAPPGEEAMIQRPESNCFASVKNGVATIQEVPSGENKIKLWSPHLKQELEVTTKTTTAVFSVAETDLARITPVIGCPVDAPSEY